MEGVQKGANHVRISEVLYWTYESTKRDRTHAQADSGAVPSSDDLTKLVIACTNDGRLKHSRNLSWSRAFLSKTRFLSGAGSRRSAHSSRRSRTPSRWPLAVE